MPESSGRGNNETTPRHYESAKNKIDITATAEKNLCGRLSFKGGVQQTLVEDAANVIKEKAATKFGAGKLAEKIAGWKSLPSILKLFNDQSLIAEAFYALVVTAGLRPVINIITPAKNEDERIKNEYRAANSIASGVIGCVFTILFAKPIGDAVDKLIKQRGSGDTAKYLTKQAEQLTINNGKTFKELAKRVHQPVFMPVRAAITIAMVPPLLAAMGIKKKTKQNSSNLSEILPAKEHPKVFRNFCGGIANAN